MSTSTLKYHCGTCEKDFDDRQLWPLRDCVNLAQRLVPGEVVPVGEHIPCGTLAYAAKPWTPDNPQLACPPNLSEKGQQAWEIIAKLLYKHDLTATGGCQVFWAPAVWEARGEKYCTKAELVVVYDGAEAKYLCSLDGERYDINEEMQQALGAAGLYYEEGTHWYGGVYP